MNGLPTFGSYTVVSKAVRKALAKQITVDDPFARETDLKNFRDVVSRGKELLPERYHRHYLDVLETALDQAQTDIDSGRSRKAVLDKVRTVFSNLAQPVTQLEDSRLDEELKAYMAVISNLYRRFVEDEYVSKKLVANNYVPDLDPLGFLVGFDQSPHAIEPTEELPVAFIAKPAHYAAYTPFYVIDAHEVGGHVLLSSIKGFTTEIENAVRKGVRSQAGKRSSNLPEKVKVPRKPFLFQKPYKYVNPATFLSETFAKWSTEIFCDIAGVLNLGPAFVDGLILLLANANSNERLLPSCVYSISDGVSTHPPQVLRVLSALATLEALEFDGKEGYLDALKRRYLEACGAEEFSEINFLGESGETIISFKLEDLKPFVENVACLILNCSAKSLGNRGLKELMTWGSKDEATVRNLVDELISGHVDENTPIEARHVVAASVLALEKVSGQTDFEAVMKTVNGTAMNVMATLFEEQCLFCEKPAFKQTRRQDIFSWSSIVDMFESLVRR